MPSGHFAIAHVVVSSVSWTTIILFLTEYNQFMRLRLLLCLVGLPFLLLVRTGEASGQTGHYTWAVFSALNNVQDVAFDSDDRLWVATTGGVVGSRTGDSDIVYRTTDGLLALNCTAIAVDPANGDLFIGAHDGTISVRRSGGGWSYSADIAALVDRPARRINDFAFGPHGVYIATSFGVGLYDPRDTVFLESYLKFDPWPQNTAVNAIAIVEGRIWLGTNLGLTSAPIDGAALSSPAAWSALPELLGDTVTSIAVIEGGLVVGTMRGAYDVRGGVVAQRPDLPAQRVMLAGAGGSCVAAAGDRAYRLQAGSFVEIGTAPMSIAAIADGGSPGVGIGMPGGGFGLMAGGVMEVRIPNAPASNRFTDLALAADGALWAASADREDAGSGVSRLFNGMWTRFTRDNTPELPTNSVWNVGPGANGSVWAGTFGAGVIEFSARADGTIMATRYDTSNSPLLGIPSNRAFVLAGKAIADRSGRTWITNWDEAGTVGPIVVVKLAEGEAGRDGSSWESFPHPSFRQRPYKWIAIDEFGTKWIGADLSLGAHPGLVFVNDNGTPWDETDDTSGVITASPSSGGLLSDRQTALVVDRDGELWIGTPNGVSVLVNPGSVVRSGSRPIFRTISALRDQFVRAICVDALNRKWIGTEKGVILVSFDGLDVLATFSTSNSPLASNDVRSLLSVEATGDVYIGTTNGLSRVRTEAVTGTRTDARLKITPQPFRPAVEGTVRIEGLPDAAVVKILTLSGSIVREFDSPGGAVAYWDGRDDSGATVRSGIYLVAAGSPQGDVTAVGKVAVIAP